MSLEFSGHTTRSGRFCCPAVTRAASSMVASTWLLSTAWRWALKSRPSRGTLPCTIATVTSAPDPAVATGTSSAPAVSATATTAGASTGVHRRAGAVAVAPPAGSAGGAAVAGPVVVSVPMGLAGRRVTQPRQAAVTSSPPTSATANVTSGAPPSAARRSSGDSSWLNANRPHGNPPNGVRSRSASCPTQSSPVTAGHAQRLRSASGDTQAVAAPSSAR